MRPGASELFLALGVEVEFMGGLLEEVALWGTGAELTLKGCRKAAGWGEERAEVRGRWCSVRLVSAPLLSPCPRGACEQPAAAGTDCACLYNISRKTTAGS